MCLDYMMKQLIPMMHTPIFVCRRDGAVTKQFGGQNLPDTLLLLQESFRRSLWTHGSSETPVLLKWEDAVFAVMLCEPEQEMILAEPCPSLQMHCQNAFLSGVLLLWNAMTGKVCSVSDLAEDTEVLVQLEKRVEHVIFERQERQAAHNPYSKEQREQECIRTGDIAGLRQCINETYEGEFGILAREPLRQSKNIAIGMITMASRSAIAGGLYPELSFQEISAYFAFTSQSYFTRQFKKSTGVTPLMYRQMLK